MLVVLIALQLAGFAVLYLVLRRRIDRAARGADAAPPLRAEVAELIVELNGAAERNVTLLEDRIKGLTELLRQADRYRSGPQPPAAPGAAAERVAQVRRLRRLGFSSAVIAERLGASAGEVELIVNLAADQAAGKPPPGAANP